MNQFNKVSRIALGSVLAILLADALGLDNSISAGIITLLTIQDTKKETIFISLKRLAAFLLAALFALVLFPTLGFSPVPFGIFLFLFVGSCLMLGLQEAIAMNCVLATHYILSQRIDFPMVINEALLLLLGAGIGTLINLFMPNNVKQIRSIQEKIESDLRKILFRMAYFLQEEDKSSYQDPYLSLLIEDIQLGLTYAHRNRKNTLFQESQYFIRYMELRKQQLQILTEIYEKLRSLRSVPEQSLSLSQFVEKIANSLAESNNAKALLIDELELEESYRTSPLPVTRTEFEDRAVLFMILKDFKIFLMMKAQFSDTLTKEQIQKYWKDGEASIHK